MFEKFCTIVGEIIVAWFLICYSMIIITILSTEHNRNEIKKVDFNDLAFVILAVPMIVITHPIDEELEKIKNKYADKNVTNIKRKSIY